MTSLLEHLETLQSLLDKKDIAAAQVLVDLLMQEERNGLKTHQKKDQTITEALDSMENSTSAASTAVKSLLQRLGRSSVP